MHSENKFTSKYQFELLSPLPVMTGGQDSSSKERDDHEVEQFFDSNQQSLRITKMEKESTNFNYSNNFESSAQ